MDDRVAMSLRQAYRVRWLFRGEWVPAIFAVLYDGPVHYKDILTAVRSMESMGGKSYGRPELSDKMLCDTLRRLVAYELLIRKRLHVGVPLSVTYSLSPATRELLEGSGYLLQWAERHADLIERAERELVTTADR